MFPFEVQGNPLFNRGFQEVFFDFLKSPLQRGFLCTLRGFFSGGGIAAANQWRLFREGILGEGIFPVDKTRPHNERNRRKRKKYPKVC